MSDEELAYATRGELKASKLELLGSVQAGSNQADIARHEAAIWQLFDRAHAVSHLLSANAALRQRIAALEAALAEAKEAIEKAAMDTLWDSKAMSAETICDKIDRVLGAAKIEEKSE